MRFLKKYFFRSNENVAANSQMGDDIRDVYRRALFSCDRTVMQFEPGGCGLDFELHLHRIVHANALHIVTRSTEPLTCH